MKISHQWLQKHLNLDETPQQIAQWLTQLGLEVSHLTAHTTIPDGVVVGEVVSCKPHSNADQLRVTKVNVGEGKVHQIICGAPNVATGQKVFVAQVGTLLPLPNGEVLKIKARKIRGENSEGMICSAEELGIQSEASEGIWVVDASFPLGADAGKVLDCEKDWLYTIDLTPNRNDAISHFGVARDLAAFLQRKRKALPPFHGTVENKREMNVRLEEESGCMRYAGLILEGVRVAPSPPWLQAALRKVGVTPINTIVDITNYITHDVGQPLHAFDYTKIEKSGITIAKAQKGSTFTTLDGVARRLNGEEILIKSGEKPLAMAGVMGGEESKITEETTTIFLESACFEPTRIMKSARFHHLHTDASYRFERGVDPNFVVTALQQAVKMIEEMAGGKVVSPLVDIYPKKVMPYPVTLRLDYLNQVVGAKIPKAKVFAILTALEIGIQEEKGNVLTLEVPPYRRDVEREIDVVEEILRHYGYNHSDFDTTQCAWHIPLVEEAAPQVQIKNLISDYLSANGFFEINNNPFIPKGLNTTVTGDALASEVEIANPLHEGYAALPQTLLFGGLRSIGYNLNRQEKDLKFFEWAKTYHQEEGQIIEREYLGLWTTGLLEKKIWGKKEQPTTLRHLVGCLTELFSYLGLPQPQQQALTHKGFSYGVALAHEGGALTHCGEVDPVVAEKFEVKVPTFFAELPLEALLKPKAVVYKPLSKYPHLFRDVSVVVDTKRDYATIVTCIDQLKNKNVKEAFLIDTYESEALGGKSYTFRFILEHPHRTLQEKEVTKIIKRIESTLENELAGTIR